jgi:hypothetical protein
LYSRLNDKQKGGIIIIMQRLHQDDLVGHVLEQEPWEHVKLPAMAEVDEITLSNPSITAASFIGRQAKRCIRVAGRA